MENLIFEQKYDSESIVDIYRDLSECFDPVYNDLMKNIEISEKNTIKVSFIYKNNIQEKVILNKNYYEESLIDLEEDITYSYQNLEVNKDEHGFFEGTLVITIKLME